MKEEKKMTREQANKIKKVLRKENAVFTSTAGYYDGKELRVKAIEFMEKAKAFADIVKVKKIEKTRKDVETRNNIIKILRALEKNGLRPEYRIEQKQTSDCRGIFDTRYVIFK